MDPHKINPTIPVDLVIDHSITVESFGSAAALGINVEAEYARNRERYEFLRWAGEAYKNLRVVPPGGGICHQINLEKIAQVVTLRNGVLMPDVVLGTDSHTTMVNALGVLGWGVGGIEAEAALLNQPLLIPAPQVVGVELVGSLASSITATDLVLTITAKLREFGVVGKFVEFYGDGLDHLPIATRATISNMSPEFGATCAMFPVDEETLSYLKLTGRAMEHIKMVEDYCKAQTLWRYKGAEPKFSQRLTVDLSKVEAVIAGPKRPQQTIRLGEAREAQQQAEQAEREATSTAEGAKENTKGATQGDGEGNSEGDTQGASEGAGEGNPQGVGDSHLANQNGSSTQIANTQITNGAVVIAAITSCTNTSNPALMLAAGLVATKAARLGLKSCGWVKTSMAPGSAVVEDYLNRCGLMEGLEAQGFHIVGYGCTTCIGNSGPLPDWVEQQVSANNLTVASVLSGNRNFEGRIHPLVKCNYLASPPLVVAYALAGTMHIDLTKEPLGKNATGEAIYLKDIMPTQMEVAHLMAEAVTPKGFTTKYKSLYAGSPQWQALTPPKPTKAVFEWDARSTYLKPPPVLEGKPAKGDITKARALAILGDFITTDHISPAGSIGADSPAAQYLNRHKERQFSSYGARRGNHEVMIRGTFANPRLQNQMADAKGGWTKLQPDNRQTTIYEAAMEYAKRKTPLLVFAGEAYGSGSSRDWAAKGTKFLGVKAVVAVSFERIHRSNLAGMGVLPLQFPKGVSAQSLNLRGDEEFDIIGIQDVMKPKMAVELVIRRGDQGGTQGDAPQRGTPQRSTKAGEASGDPDGEAENSGRVVEGSERVEDSGGDSSKLARGSSGEACLKPASKTEKVELICRLDTNIEASCYYPSGGMLPYVLNNMG